MYHALEVWAPVKGGGFSDTIVAAGLGGTLFTSPGWSGDTLVWSSASGDNSPQRFSYVRLSSNQMRLDWSVAQPDGPYAVGDTLTCDRDV